MSQAKKIFWQATQYSAGSGLTLLASLISYPILARVFSPTEYGIMALLSSSIFGFVALGKLGLQHAAIRFLAECESDDKRADLRTSLTIAAASSGACAALLLCFVAALVARRGEREVAGLIVLASPVVMLETVKSLMMNFLRAAQYSGKYTTLLTVDKYGQLGLSLLILWFRRTLFGFYTGWLSWNLVLLPCLLAYFISRREIRFKRTSFALLKPAILFGAPLLFFEFGNMLLTYSDRYLVAHFLGAKATGLYAAPYNLTLSVQGLFLVPLTSIIFPWASSLWTANGPAQTSKFASKALDYFLIITVPIIAGSAALAPDLIRVLASAKYSSTSNLLFPLITAQVLFGVYHILALGLFVQKRTRQLAAQIIAAAAFNVLLNLWFIPHLGLIGAALTTLVGYLLLVVMALRVSVKLLPVKLNAGLFGTVLASATLMGVLVKMLPVPSSFLRLIIGIPAGVAFYGGCIFAFRRDVRSFANEILNTNLA